MILSIKLEGGLLNKIGGGGEVLHPEAPMNWKYMGFFPHEVLEQETTSPNVGLGLEE